MSGIEFFCSGQELVSLFFPRQPHNQGFITKSIPQLDSRIRIFTVDGYVQTSLPSMPCTPTQVLIALVHASGKAVIDQCIMSIGLIVLVLCVVNINGQEALLYCSSL